MKGKIEKKLDLVYRPQNKITRCLLLLSALFAIGCAPKDAFAENITFGIIGPHEYELPVNFKPFNVFVQYGQFNSASDGYDGHGRSIYGSGTNQFVGLSKYVFFFCLPGVQNVGFAYEVIPTEVAVTSHGKTIGGLGDPLTGFAMWIKPTPNSTLGIQSFVQAPIGMTAVSNGYWANYSSILFDVQWPMLSITGDLGAVIPTVQNLPGVPQAQVGTIFHFNGRFGWVNRSIVEPFLAVDWQTQAPTYAIAGGAELDPHSEETALGFGLMFKFSPKLSLTVRYSHAVQGYNVDATNAGYFKLAYVW